MKPAEVNLVRRTGTADDLEQGGVHGVELAHCERLRFVEQLKHQPVVGHGSKVLRDLLPDSNQTRQCSVEGARVE
jgi:hypothetical protein